ncbi:hypothetical protein K466DRAFT_663122 [Polyporus arcularius HHB13444]|uniref:Fungal-type protein kinase domain-containing protein n=1 Tax=Polyporus arcularius HHB13444 TaxID=1314778 RepID=A0A5C3PCE8_9APHY|nr:hypothetical protein K466DRAFT_663122 [Polyporus arcularius HHB13444]
MTGRLKIDYEDLSTFRHKKLELKDQTAQDHAAERGAREGGNDRDCPMPMSVFRTLLGHARTHYPVEHWTPSNMILYLIMLRITSVLSTPDKQVICIPERSWLRAAAFGTKPYTPEGLVHHMLIRADNAAARFITFDPIESIETPDHEWLKTLEVTHIFEAKTRSAFTAAFEYVSTLLKYWCERTGKAHGRAALTREYTWQFISYHAPQDGRPSEVHSVRQPFLYLTVSDIDTILGLLLDMVDNTSQETQEYFSVV